MKFQKGKSSWNKGTNLSGMKGKHHTEETKIKIGESNKGKEISLSTKLKISKTLKGHIPWNKGKKTGKSPNKGFRKGHIPWNYIDGRSKKIGPARYGDDWNEIRYLIYYRDNFKCQKCGINMHESEKKFNEPLHVHHKIPFLKSFDNSLNNLITLCKSCHTKEDYNIIKNKNK